MPLDENPIIAFLQRALSEQRRVSRVSVDCPASPTVLTITFSDETRRNHLLPRSDIKVFWYWWLEAAEWQRGFKEITF